MSQPEVKKRMFVDDEMTHLVSDIEKIRVRHRQYISYSNEAGAKSVTMEGINNAFDECRNPESPGDSVDITFRENSGTITISDNGRGMPLSIIEDVYTSLNYGSNIYTSNKASLNAETLGQNGVGTLALCGLAERLEITSYRGPQDGKVRRLVFEEGIKIEDETKPCHESKHGLTISYKPSAKVMGKKTKIIWSQIHEELLNFQFMNPKKIKVTSHYYDKNDRLTTEKYKPQEFEEILTRNEKKDIIGPKVRIQIEEKNLIEEIDGKKTKKYLSMDIAFVHTSSLTPYIDSFSNSNNTVDNGGHLDGALEALCRYFQNVTKASMSEKEKSNLDIKWDDVRQGLSLAVALRTNYESLYTGQTKHKIVSEHIEEVIRNLTMEELTKYFAKNPNKLKEIIATVKLNARVRREGDKTRSAVMKDKLNVWSSFKMKNYDPCTNKGKEYKELYIIEGDSAKGSLKNARDAKYQALFAIRGVSANVFKLDLNGILANAEFNALIKVMGCDVGAKFDLNKLQFNKIVIATDADVDGLFIRSLLCSFFIKVFPEIIEDGRLFIAEPPLYRVDDKKNPFVINKEDYISRYIDSVLKEYKIGYWGLRGIGPDPVYDDLNRKDMISFLADTSSYVDDITQLSYHYKVSDRLLEMLIEEWTDPYMDRLTKETEPDLTDVLNTIDSQKMMNRITGEFPELYYDEKDHLIKGVIDGKYQLLELSESLLKRCTSLIKMMYYNGPYDEGTRLVLKGVKTHESYELSLLGTLKILKKFQPNITHRFKGLGENNDVDIKQTIMDPNTRTLIRLSSVDIKNDIKTFQMLRGTSPQDAAARKSMMRAYKIPRDLIDT